MSIFEDIGRALTGGHKRTYESDGTDEIPYDQRMGNPETMGGGVGTVHHEVVGDRGTFTPDVDNLARYRSMGAAAANRPAYQLNESAAQDDVWRGQQARQQQLAASQQMKAAAMGMAPSRADIMGNQAAGNSLEGALSASAGARGMGALAAQRQAQMGMGAQQQQSLGQYVGMRSGELNDARGAYAGNVNATRSGDYAVQGSLQQMAQDQAKSEMAQRGLNDQAQQGYEQLGINEEQAQSDADIRRMQMQAQSNQQTDDAHDAQNARYQREAIGGMQAIGTFGSGSDERMKNNVVPLTETPGMQRHWDRDVSSAPDVTSGASLSGPVPRYSSMGAAAAKTPAKASAKAKPGQRRMTTAELEQYGRDLLAKQRATSEAQLRAGPSVRQEAEPSPTDVDQIRYGAPNADYVDQIRNGVDREPNRGDVNIIKHGMHVADASMPPPAPPPRGLAYTAGVQAAPRGYAASRALQPGSMFAPGQAPSNWDARMGAAPGTRDFLKYGDPGPRPMDPYSQQVALSDERTKTSRVEGGIGRDLAQGLAPYQYEYKPGFDAAENQHPGERNVGPMAQNMASNPVTATAVKRGDNGLLYIDQPKALKVSLGGIGYLAAQQQRQQAEIDRLKGRG